MLVDIISTSIICMGLHKIALPVFLGGASFHCASSHASVAFVGSSFNLKSHLVALHACSTILKLLTALVLSRSLPSSLTLVLAEGCSMFYFRSPFLGLGVQGLFVELAWCNHGVNMSSMLQVLRFLW